MLGLKKMNMNTTRYYRACYFDNIGKLFWLIKCQRHCLLYQSLSYPIYWTLRLFEVRSDTSKDACCRCSLWLSVEDGCWGYHPVNIPSRKTEQNSSRDGNCLKVTNRELRWRPTRHMHRSDGEIWRGRRNCQISNLSSGCLRAWQWCPREARRTSSVKQTRISNEDDGTISSSMTVALLLPWCLVHRCIKIKQRSNLLTLLA